MHKPSEQSEKCVQQPEQSKPDAIAGQVMEFWKQMPELKEREVIDKLNPALPSIELIDKEPGKIFDKQPHKRPEGSKPISADVSAVVKDVADGDFDSGALQNLYQLFDMRGVPAQAQEGTINKRFDQVNAALEQEGSPYRISFGVNTIKALGGTHLDIYNLKTGGSATDGINFIIPNFKKSW